MSSSSASLKNLPLDPEYIQFLLDPDLGFSCYFVVGNAELAPVEKIGVVKKMLAAHSSVFRAQLTSRQWESKDPEEITDIIPATFKNLLRFVYGFDTVATMNFEDADDLLYVADRYIMKRLKDKLATRLRSLLNYTNICSLLANPACATVLELHSEMTKILQCETDKVLGSPQFLSCCPDAFVKILEQEVMNVPELEVWKTALRWAKNKVQSEDVKSIRLQLDKPLHHIRLCSLSRDEFCDEVVPSGVLSGEEMGAVCTAIVTKKPQTLKSLSNNMQVRRGGKTEYVKSRKLSVGLSGEKRFANATQGSFSLQTHELAIELTELDIKLDTWGDFTATLKIESAQEKTRTLTFTGRDSVPDKISTLYVSTKSKSGVLVPNTKYTITLTYDEGFYVWLQRESRKTLQHFTLQFGSESNGRQVSPVYEIRFRTLTPK